MSSPRIQLAASSAGTLVVVAAFVLAVSSAGAASGKTAPAPGKLVTFVARVCPSYSAVTANLARNNIQESLQDLGADTLYHSGQAIDPTLELQGQPTCTPLSDWTFTLGTGIVSRAVTGPWGALSIVTTPFATSIVTQPSVPLLNSLGEDTGTTIAGATTIRLTTAQENLAAHSSSLWAQGGTTTDPVLDQQFPGQYGFAALRCGIDNLNGDNVEWIAYPSGSSHVFCFAYYVKPPPTSGTIIVQKQVASPAGATQQFRFVGNISYAADSSFTLGVVNGAAASETFYRAETKAGDTPWDFQEQVPSGWKLNGISCTSQTGKSTTTTDTTTAKTAVTLAAGDTVVCTYTDAQIPPPGGLAITKTTIGGTGTFGYTVTAASSSGPAPIKATATTTAPGVEVPADPSSIALPAGSYTIAETLPKASNGSWKLTGVQCNGATVPPVSPVTVTISSGSGAACAFENTFTPAGEIVIHKIAYGRTGTAGFTIYGNAPSQFSKTAVVTEQGVAVLAKGDATNALPLGTYRIQEFAAGGTDPAGWTLTSVVCNGTVVGASQGAVTVKLTADEPSVDCTFANAWTEIPNVVDPPPVLPPDPQPDAQLTVTKTADKHTITVGEIVTYTIVVHNVGGQAAQGVSIAEQTPLNGEIVSVDPSQGTCNTDYRPASCYLGTIEPGASATVIAKLRGTKVGTLANDVAVNSATIDPKPPETGTEGDVIRRPPKPKPPIGAFAG